MKRKEGRIKRKLCTRRLIADIEARGCVMGVGAKRVSERKREREREKVIEYTTKEREIDFNYTLCNLMFTF